MAYLNRYIGKYRVVATLDTEGNFTENKDDIYIRCRNFRQKRYKGEYTRCEISHYGQSVLCAYIPSTQKGNSIVRILKSIEKGNIDYLDDKDKILKLCNLNDKIIRWTDFTDNEVEIYFHSKYIDIIAYLCSAQTSGASIRPFSVKNLPKSKQEEKKRLEQLPEYKDIKKLLSEIAERDDKNLLATYNLSFRKFNEKYKINVMTKARAKKISIVEFIYNNYGFDKYKKIIEKM